MNIGKDMAHFAARGMATYMASGAGLSILGGAVAALGAAAASTTVKLAQQAREMSNMARISNLSVDEYKNQAFAAAQYGITVDQLSDQFKDAREKIGDFLATGGGALQDFGDVMGYTKQQTADFARSVQNLSGREVLTRMTDKMQEAGKSAEQVSFALEGMASDATLLIPLLQDGGKEFDSLSAKMDAVTIPLTDEDIEIFRELSANVDLATGAFSSMLEQALLPFVPLASDAAKKAAELSSAMGYLFASLREGTEESKLSRLVEINDDLTRLQKTLSDNAKRPLFGVDPSVIEEKITALKTERDAIRDELAKPLSEPAAAPKSAPVSQGKTKLDVDLEAATKKSGELQAKQAESEARQLAIKQAAADAYLQSLQRANFTELELINAHEADKLSKISELRQQGLISDLEYAEARKNALNTSLGQRLEIELAAEQKLADEQARIREESIALAQEQEDRLLSSASAASSSLGMITSAIRKSGKEQSAAYKVLFAAQQAAAIPSMIVATEEGAAKALSLGPIAGPIAAGLIKGLGYASIGVVAGQAISGAREQGGSMIGGSAYQMAERGKAEVIVPSGSSRARTASQMRDIMGENSGGKVSSVVIINQTTGRIDQSQVEQDDDGQLRITIREVVAGDLANQDSQIAKARRQTRGEAGY